MIGVKKMVKKVRFGVNTYVHRTKRKLGRHKKRMNKAEKRNFKPSIGQGSEFRIILKWKRL